MRKVFEVAVDDVTCAALGHRSASVLATGGRDRDICLWMLGDPNCRCTLSGFVNRVECVTFSWNEGHLAAGSSSGAVKVWDIKKGIAICTFTGHRGKVKCLAQNPFDDRLWASGAFDGNVKVWDTRNSAAITTYKAHFNKSVTAMEFSPDGRWLVTGGEDCKIRLWDIVAGKSLAELLGHSAPVTSVQFHPNIYLLASGSQDKTVRFWDMESYECVSQSAPDSAGAVQSILFDIRGRCLYSASCGGGIRVYGWEPARLFDSESCPSNWASYWHQVVDLGMSPDEQMLIACCLSAEENCVAAFSVDALPLRPIWGVPSESEESEVNENNNDFVISSIMRRSFHKSTNGQPTTPIAPAKLSPAAEDDDDTVKNRNPPAASPGLPLQGKERDVAFRSRPKLSRSPPTTPVPSDPTNSVETSSRAPSVPRVVASLSTNEPSGVTIATRQPSPARVPKAATSKTKTTAAVTPFNPGASKKAVNQVPPLIMGSSSLPSADRSHQGHGPVPEVKISAFGKEVQSKLKMAFDDAQGDCSGGLEENGGLREGKSSLGRTYTLSPDDFLPQSFPSKPLGSTFTVFDGIGSTPSLCGATEERARFMAPSVAATEDECLSACERGMTSMSAVLDHRLKSLRMVHGVWKGRGPLAAMELACQMNDLSIVVDLLNIFNFRSNLWKLDLCVIVLPHVRKLLESKYEAYVHTAVCSLRLMLRSFGTMIKNGMQSAGQVPSIGVDLSQEERTQKCQKCYGELLAIRDSVSRKQKTSGAGEGRNLRAYRELNLLMQSLDLC